MAVEYYHPGLDHYFVTADALEIEALTSGKFSGWLPTGEKFAVLPPDSSIASSTPVCRFYGDPSKGLNSHFYSGIPEECARVKTQFADSWLLESDDVYRAFLPDASGSCPAGTEAVYRLWNNRADVNHRYTTSADIAKQMKALGYIAEGFGAALSIPVALCAPVGMACALAAANPMPAVGSVVTLTSTCTGNPTSYVWSGCDSNSESCSATSTTTGVQTYGVVAIGPAGASAPTAIALNWQPVALTASGTTANPSLPGSAASCSVSASNTAPAVGSSITLSALCTVIPTSYRWTGCASTASTCTATSSTGGSVTYSVSATTPGGAIAPASVTVNWHGTASFAPTLAPTSSSTPTPAPTPIAAIPAGEARVISSNTLRDVWQGPQPAGGGTIDKGLQWCSAIYAPTLGVNGSLVFSGGGDADSWDTAAFAFDIAVGKWTRIKDRTNALSWDPAIDAKSSPTDPHHWSSEFGEHGDGTPGAPHTYDLVTYLPPEAVGGKGALLFPVSRFAYTEVSTNWAHKLSLDQPAWSRASTAPATPNMNLLGMSDYDPTSKRVWIVPATTTGAQVSEIAYLDYSAGAGVPGTVSLGGKDYLIYNGTMRFWRGVDGTKRYLVMLSYDPRARINIIDLDAPQTGVHPVAVANVPQNFGYPGSGFALGKTRGFAMHPTPDQDGSQIYEITPGAIDATWTVTPKPLNGIALPADGNVGLWKRLEYVESLGVVTFFISASGPVYAYRPTTNPSTVPTATTAITTTPSPAPTPTTTTTPPTPTPTTTAPTPSTGSLKLVSSKVPYTGPGMAIATSKHLDFARVGNRWYKAAGDHVKIDSNTPDEQGGRQEIISFNVPANDWREDKPYFLRSGMNRGSVEIANPDDGGVVARNGTEIWSFVSERVLQLNTADQTASVRASYGSDIVTQDMEDVGAWNPTTGLWRVGGPRPQEMKGDNTWRWLWDSGTDHFIGPTASSFIIFDNNGVDISPRFGGALQDYGSFDFHSSGIVQDGRNAYVYDQAHGALYRFNLDQSPFQLVKVLDLPDITWTVAGRGITIVWHPLLRAVVILGYGADSKGRMYAFEVDSGKLTGWARPDGFVNGVGTWVSPSTSFYDPDTTDIVSIGGIDWDTGITSSVYWRMHLSQ